MGQNVRFAFKLLAPFFALGSLCTMFAGSTLPGCGTNTLLNYVTITAFPPVSGGCAVGVLDYYNFTYHPVSNAPSASSIEVTPGASGFSFSGLSGPITAAAGTTVSFEIDYQIVIDPAPILTGGDLQIDPPSGNVTVTEYFCNNIPYTYSGFCLGSPTPAADTLTVGTIAPNVLSKTIVFPDPATTSQQVGILFTLVGGTNSSSSFDGLDAEATVLTLTPEPGSAGAVFMGLLALGGGYKLRKRSKQ